MMKILLYLLEKIPYRTKFGLSLSDLLKIKYNRTHPYKCLCGGRIIPIPHLPEGLEIICEDCNFLYDED